MKNNLLSLAFSVQKINRYHLQFILTVIALAMLVLGVGAPVDSGGGPK